MKQTPLLFLLILVLSAYTFGATYTVTRTDDRDSTCLLNDCSLREAVKAANISSENDNILFNSQITTITLSSEIVIESAGALTITGNSANVLTISGNNATRLFYAINSTTIISDVTLTKGNGFSNIKFDGVGGALVSHGGSMTLNHVNVVNNFAASSGGAIFFNGTPPYIGANNFINNSTISGNTSNNGGGGILNEGTTLTVSNSTISGNRSNNAEGGGIATGGLTIFRNVTLTNNYAQTGGGVYNSDRFVFSNSIIAGNVAVSQSGFGHDILFQFGTSVSEGNNLVGDVPGGGDSSNTGKQIAYQPSDLRDVDPKLSPLQDNGGATFTHALLSGSPATNAGSNENAPATDQRGFTRIVGGTIDIGSYESNYAKTRKRVRLF